MKHYIVGDLHGSGLELEALLNDISPGLDDKIILLGDVFDRGFHGHVVWRIIKETGAIVLRGNHEEKMLKFLMKQRTYLPPHYYWCLNNLVNNGVSVDELVEFLKNLPLLLLFHGQEGDFITVHAGVNINNPAQEDISWNLYGKMFHSTSKEQWWDVYSGDVPIYYGHSSEKDGNPRRRGTESKITSLGLDTSVVHGGYLTAFCPETKQFYRHRSGVDHYGLLKGQFKCNPPIICDEINQYLSKS